MSDSVVLIVLKAFLQNPAKEYGKVGRTVPD